MKKIVFIFLIVAVFIFLVISAEAKDRRKSFGMGICVGDPVGMNCKYWFTENKAFDISLAWRGNDQIYFHINYLVHNFKSIAKGSLTGEMPLYHGVGVRADRIIQGQGDLSMGIRGVIGVNYLFEEMTGDIFAELVPTLIIEPDTTMMICACIGARYYFD